MKNLSLKQVSRKIAVILTMLMLFTAFACTLPAEASSNADMKKANVKWDLKNNKKLTYKQYWYSLGVKKHTVKMTKFKVKNASKAGYKQCTFTLTYNMKIKPTKKQVKKMVDRRETGKLWTQYGFCIVDYKTGMSLGVENDKDVTATWKWHYSKYQKIKGPGKYWMSYPRKVSVNVKIIYPKDYKDLCIGAVGVSSLKLASADAHWNGKKPFSKAASLYSKKDKSFAHFMRVK